MRTIDKLLVANRGEIALRVMRTARGMGIETVAIYSEADHAAPHVAFADVAVCVGPAPSPESYLNIDAIIRAAVATGADAVHPGYGFLSENADFARACTDAGLIFVGPPADAIVAMGDKAEAKRIMREAGLPCVPGYDGEDQDPAHLAEAAARIGYPVMVKATAGGGGRGMRAVTAPEDFARALDSARSEARNAFGNDRMLVERIVVEPRHIEIQVLIDRHGHGVHFGERDCSVQRRHQKLIEEAPAPRLDPALRERMGQASVAAAIRLGYEGVGTFEFLLDGRGEFYFMEMNTRLQVEHPVTESIAGVDLVEWQLRVAMDEPLDLAQQDVAHSGHAIEVRLCAEDEFKGFLPQSGRIALWRTPDTIRVDHAVASGYEIQPYYDSMFAKLIASGRNREEARRKLVAALRATIVFGLKTNREALIRCLEHPAFIQGGVSTAFLQEHAADLIKTESRVRPLAVALAAVGLCGPSIASGRPVMIKLGDENAAVHDVLLAPDHGRMRVTLADAVLDLTIRSVTQDEIGFSIDGIDRKATIWAAGARIYIQIDGGAATFDDMTYAPAVTARERGTDGRLRAQTNGRVSAIEVAIGDVVAEGAPVVTVEAMKMEYTHTAPIAGRVTAIAAVVGGSVASGATLLEITPEEG